MMPELLTFLSLLPIQALCLLPLRHQLKCSPLRTAVLLSGADLLLIPAAAWISFRFSPGLNAVLFLTQLAFFAVMQVCLKCPLCKSLSVFLAACALTAILSNVVCIMEARMHPESGADLITPEGAWIRAAVNGAAAGLLAFPLWKYGARLVNRLDLETIWLMTLPFSLVLIVINLFMRPLRYETLYVNNVYRSYLFLVFSSLTLWVLLCGTFYFVVSGILRAAEQREKIQLLEMQESQFAAQRRYMEASSRARHDFRQSLLTMRNLAHAGDFDALRRYIDTYFESLPRQETVRYCRISALNALLNYYSGKAREEKIKAVFRVDLPDALPVSDVDLCAIVGNILENAILACMDVPEGERQLHLTMRVMNGSRLFLVVTNSHGGHIRQRNGKYLSSRQRGEGIGLKSVMTTAAQYGGKADFSHDEKEFVSNVMLPLKQLSSPEPV